MSGYEGLPDRMRAVVVDSFGAPPSVRTVAVPAVPADGVVVRVERTGLCRSDVGGWLGHDDGIRLPYVPGHEFTGRVAAVGKDVQSVLIGERVTVPFVCACGSCAECAAGNAQVCRHQTQPGFTHDGSFAEYVAVRHADVNILVLGDDFDGDSGALLGCRFATSYRGLVQQARCTADDRVLVTGCGGVGLSAIMIARSVGARVVAVDVDDSALARARELGAAHTVSARDRSESELLAAIGEAMPDGATVSVDALGREDTLGVCIRSLAARGRHVQIGLLAEPPRVPMAEVIARELSIAGSHGMSAADYSPLLDAVRAGSLRPADVVTSRIGLDDVPAAMAEVAAGTWRGGVTIIDL